MRNNEGGEKMDTSAFKPGDLLLIQYGNGTQVARVVSVGKRGGLVIERGYPYNRDQEIGWSPSKLRANDARVLGLLPERDPRRRLLGFTRTAPDAPASE